MSLVTIQRIDNLTPIPNADFIETAHVLGWTVVVKKDEFEVGDLCVYIEIDSLLPRKEWSEFLFKKEDETVYRLRTVKLKKQLSQGLVLPVNETLPYFSKSDSGYIYADTDEVYNWNRDTDDCLSVIVGQDVSDLLKIKHYEKPINDNPHSGIQSKGIFPSFLHKTDEVRIQSAPELLEQLKGKPYYITQKMDGTSTTFYKYKGVFGVCSRNVELKDPTKIVGTWWKVLHDKIKRFLFPTKKEHPREFALDIYWRMCYKYKIQEWLPDGYAIQGEICGPGIQENKLGLDNNELYIFNVWNINRQEYEMPSEMRTNIGGYIYDFCKLVPRIDDGLKFNLALEDLIKLSNANLYPNKTLQEGIVVRSVDQTISFKVVNNEFLLKYGE